MIILNKKDLKLLNNISHYLEHYIVNGVDDEIKLIEGIIMEMERANREKKVKQVKVTK